MNTTPFREADLGMYALWGGLFFCLSIWLQHVWIGLQHRMSIQQTQKSYGVGIDADIKAKTPSMGGAVFLVLAAAALAVKFSATACIFWSLPIAGGVIGLIDDGKKFFSHSSEGFRSMMKLKTQLAVCAVWTAALWSDGRLGIWPGVSFTGDWIVSIFLAFIGSAGMMNAVNITDGLDGLAGGCFMISTAACTALIPPDEFNMFAETVLFFMVGGFMIHNIHPAATFMGDTGSHFLGGALAALCVMNGRTLALIPVGFMFGIEMLSSAIQIFTIRKLNKRVFRMAPLHHHFQLPKRETQTAALRAGDASIAGSFKPSKTGCAGAPSAEPVLKGWNETRVTAVFWLVHALGAAWLSLVLLSFGR